MPQNWERGNAAMQPSYDENAARNPFTPVDYAKRLQNAPRKRYTPPVPSAPPMPQRGYEVPQYMQPQQNQLPPQQAYVPQQPQQAYVPQQPMQDAAGAPYSAALFTHQPTAVMPNGRNAQPAAANAPADHANASPVPRPVWQEDVPEAAPRYYSAEDIPLRDPFTPARSHENDEQQPEEEKKPAKDVKAQKNDPPPIRIDRLLALPLALVMIIICVFAGGRMIGELMRNDRETKEHEANGMQVYAGAIQVELPPAGQTFPPEPNTPTPEPLDSANAAMVPGEEVTATPTKRSKLTSYPKNPMRNITESLREMHTANSDVVGRLVIDGLVDEMVMQRNNTYYLTHNSNGITSDAGAVFADQSCVLRNPPENLLLRGQSGVGGKVFAPLWQFVSGGQQFAAAHRFARFIGLYDDELYVLLSVMVVDINPTGSRYFNYASSPSFTTDEAMLSYVESMRSRSLYQFGADVQPTDRLLTIATLGSGDTNLVLLYRMVRDNEQAGL